MASNAEFSPSQREATVPEPRTIGERHTFVQLFGPVQNEGSLQQTASAAWSVPGAATSTSFKPFWFQRAWQRVTWASWRVEWRPGSSANMLRLIHCDDGITNIQVIAEIAGSTTTNPTASSRDVTRALQELGRAGRQKQIGWQVRGDGRTRMQIYQVHLEILEAV